MLPRALVFTLLLLAAAGCMPQNNDAPIGEEIPAPENLKSIAAGEVVYVPAYARIHHLKLKDRTAALVTTLAVHNTDMKQAIVEWVAEAPVARPLIESIMVSTDHTLGISFMSHGYKIGEAGAR